MKDCPTSTTLVNPVSMQNLLTLSFGERLWIRSSDLCNWKFWYARVILLQRNFCLDFTENNWLSHQCIREPQSTLMGFRLFATAPRRLSWFAEIIMRKTTSIVSWSAAKCIDSFPSPLLLSLHLDNGIVARKIGHPLSTNSTSIFSVIWSQIPWGLFSSIEDHFFSEPGPINDHCPIPNFFANIERTLAFAKHSSSLFSCHKKCRWPSTWIEFFLWKFLVILLICSVDLWLYRRAAT